MMMMIIIIIAATAISIAAVAMIINVSVALPVTKIIDFWAICLFLLIRITRLIILNHFYNNFYELVKMTFFMGFMTSLMQLNYSLQLLYYYYY
jgi:hypothetical protein